MQADSFYQSHNNQALPLYLVTKQQWEQGLADVTEAAKSSFFEQQFKANAGELCFMQQEQEIVKVYLGVGDKDDANAITLAMMRLPAGSFQPQQPLSSLAQLTWGLVQYYFDQYKKQTQPVRVLVLTDEEHAKTTALVAAIFRVRDLINKPANDMGPVELAFAAQTLAAEYHADFHQWVGDELLTANFPAIHAVGRASINCPRLLSITWGDVNHPAVTLVGKGVCFDSGGLNLKPASGMRIMKKDMGGAAHVLGLAAWLMSQQLPIRLQVLIPAVDNAIGPNSFRPGDVLTMRNGLTVEIDNTDAEGRLVLADALVKAADGNPELIIDFATLTGAARVAVGTEISAMFSNDDAVAADLLAAAQQVDDPVWRMPLFSGYESLLDSSIADMVNASPTPYAGAITAALFLQRFIPVNTPWVHFDIMAWRVGNKPGKPEGGEAMAVRAVAQYLQTKYGS